MNQKCEAWRNVKEDGRTVTLVCGRSRGHSVLYCLDQKYPDRGWLAPDRVGFPKIQPLGVRKLRPVAAELADGLESLRHFLDPDNPNCAVPPEFRKDPRVQSFLSTWVEGPMTRALGTVDPRFRAEEQDR